MQTHFELHRGWTRLCTRSTHTASVQCLRTAEVSLSCASSQSQLGEVWTVVVCSICPRSGPSPRTTGMWPSACSLKMSPKRAGLHNHPMLNGFKCMGPLSQPKDIIYWLETTFARVCVCLCPHITYTMSTIMVILQPNTAIFPKFTGPHNLEGLYEGQEMVLWSRVELGLG